MYNDRSMSDAILIKSKAIPSNPRSKNYPAGATVVRSGNSVGGAVITGGGGTNIDIIKVDDMRSLTDKNVLSSLRVLAEILSRIIAKDDEVTELSDSNVLSSLRVNKELDTISDRFKEAIESLKDLYLSKVKNDTASGLITFLKGIVSEGLVEANNGLVVRKTEVVEPMLMSLLSEEFRDGIVEENEDVFIEELSIRAPGSASTLGELDNVDDDADSAVLGSLFVKGENWEAVPPVLSSLTDFDNMLMPVYHQVSGKWVFISVSAISGGVTPPVTLEMVLDTGLLDVNKLA